MSFQGNNTIILCPADMMKAVEYYLNQVVLKTPVNVTGLHQGSGTNDGFTVRIKPMEKDDSPTPLKG